MARRGDGLYLRGKTWYLDCRLNGTRHVVRLGKGIGRSVASEIAQVKRGAILKGEAGIGKKRKDLSFEQATKTFLEWAVANKRPHTVTGYRRCPKFLGASFAGKSLGQIHPFLVERHKQGRVHGGARVRANREITTLKALFNRCRDWGLYEGDNPVRKVKLLQESKGRVRFLEPDEERRLLDTASEPLRSLIMLAINTGLRVQSEALTLRWADVDLPRGLLTVSGTYAKNGQTRTVPLNARAKTALRHLHSLSRGDMVFAKSDGLGYRSMRTAFELACQRAGLREVTPHTLRHTFASRLAMAGVDVRTIMELGGWQHLAMVQRYSHLSPRHKVAAVEQIADLFHNTFHNTPDEATIQADVSA